MGDNDETPRKRQKVMGKKSPRNTGLIMKMGINIRKFEGYVSRLSYYDDDVSFAERIKEREDLLRTAVKILGFLNDAHTQLSAKISTSSNTNTSFGSTEAQQTKKRQNTYANCGSSSGSESGSSANDSWSSYMGPPNVRTKKPFNAQTLYELCGSFVGRVSYSADVSVDVKYLKDFLLVAEEDIRCLNTVRNRLENEIRTMKQNTNAILPHSNPSKYLDSDSQSSSVSNAPKVPIHNDKTIQLDITNQTNTPELDDAQLTIILKELEFPHLDERESSTYENNHQN